MEHFQLGRGKGHNSVELYTSFFREEVITTSVK